jgi:O-antigen ligase
MTQREVKAAVLYMGHQPHLQQWASFYPNRFTIHLWSLFAANTAFPFFDVPLLGLSVSAVFFGLVALEIIFRSPYIKLNHYGRWLLPLWGIGCAIFLSMSVNILAGNFELSTSNAISFVQAVYWLVVCVVTMALVSHFKREHVLRLIFVLAVAAIALGFLRLYEVFFFNRVGPATARIFTQNTYGVLFSAFTPFAIIAVFLASSRSRRFLAASGLLLLVLAIILNGSRTSWITGTVSFMILVTLFALTQQRQFFKFTVLTSLTVVIASSLLLNMPSAALEQLVLRFETLDRIEQDKSYATRTLMQQKGLELFTQNPIFGIGRNQFRNSYVELDFSNTPFAPSHSAQFNRIATHNSYVEYVAEQGLVGTIPLVILLMLLTLHGVRAAINLSKQGDIWAIAILASFTALSIHLWTIDNLQTTSSWFIYGITAGMIEYERRQRALMEEI